MLLSLCLPPMMALPQAAPAAATRAAAMVNPIIIALFLACEAATFESATTCVTR